MLEASWPALRERIASFCHCDEVAKQFLALLLNVSEFQLLKLSNAHCMEVYRTAFELVQLLRDRFKGSCADDSRGSAEQESSFRCEVCMQLLDVFNLLSTKDFQFFDDDQDSSYQSFDQEIATILLFGLEMLLPVLNKDFLSSFPRVGEKFFCFVSFLTGSYVVRVASWANSGRNESIVSCSQSPSASARGNHRSLFHDLLDRLLWATRAVDAATAKSAFQVSTCSPPPHSLLLTSIISLLRTACSLYKRSELINGGVSSIGLRCRTGYPSKSTSSCWVHWTTCCSRCSPPSTGLPPTVHIKT